ncbi:MAG: C-type lectin domain-containing protein [bacterium]
MRHEQSRSCPAYLLALLIVIPVTIFGQQVISIEDINGKYKAARLKIESDTVAAYSNALVATGNQLKQKGDVDGYDALQLERRCLTTAEALPEGPGRRALVDKVPALDAVLNRLETEKLTRITALLRQYISHLELQIPKLMQADRIPEARQARDQMENARRELEAEVNKQPTPPNAEGTTEVAKRSPGTSDQKKAFPDDAAEYKGHHYKLYSDASNWDKALFLCRTRGGHLAVISDAEENAFIAGMIKGNARIWIGASKEMRAWRWCTASRFDYQNWAQGSPNDGEKIGLKVTMLGNPDQNRRDYGKWDDFPGTSSDVPGYLCEWDY